MRFSIFLILIISLIYFSTGCGPDQEELEAERRQDSIRVADSISMAEKAELERQEKERERAIAEADAFQLKIENKLKEGKAIMLTNEGETMPLKIDGTKAYAVKMPDGNLWQVKKEGDKILLVLPGGETMEQKMIDGQMYLFTDDNKYEVQMVNGKMMAVMPDSTMVAMTSK